MLKTNMVKKLTYLLKNLWIELATYFIQNVKLKKIFKVLGIIIIVASQHQNILVAHQLTVKAKNFALLMVEGLILAECGLLLEKMWIR